MPETSGVQEVIFCATPSTSGLVTQYKVSKLGSLKFDVTERARGQRSDKVAAFMKCRETLSGVKGGAFTGGDTMMRINYADICDDLTS